MTRLRFPWSRLTLAGGTTLDARRWYPLDASNLGAILDAVRTKHARSYVTWRAQIHVPCPGAEGALAVLWVESDGKGRFGVRLRLDLGDASASSDGLPGALIQLGPAWRRQGSDTLARDPEPPGAPMAAPAEITDYLAVIGDLGAARIRLLPPPAMGDSDALGDVIYGCVALAGMAALAALGGLVGLGLLASQESLTGSLTVWLLWLVIACLVTAIGWSFLVFIATRVLPPIREFVTVLLPTPAVVHDAIWLGTVGFLFVIAPLAIGVLTVAALNASPAAAGSVFIGLLLGAGVLAIGAAIYAYV